MHRTLPNILFILILFLLATAFPLSTDILSLNLSQKIVDKPVEDIIIDPELSTKLPKDPDTLSSEFITFDIESTTNVFPNDFLASYSISLSSHGNEIAAKNLTEINYEIVDTSANLKTVKISKAALLEGQSPGYYTYSLKIADETQDFVWYGSNVATDKILLKTSNKLDAGKLSITLFFPSSDYKNLVPITRHVTSPKNRWRTIYSALVDGPKKGLGLYETAPVIPYSPNIRITKDVANIFMYSKNMTGFEDKFSIVADSITKTFMTLGPLNGVNIFVDDTNKTPYGNVELSKPFTQSSVNSAFLGYSSGTTNMMLMPISLKQAPISDRLKEAWDILTFSTDTSLFTPNAIQPVPDEVQVLGDFIIDGQSLTINLSKNFTTVLNSKPEYQTLMIKSILYTYTSFPEIDTVKITVEGAPLVTEGFDFTAPFKPDLYINMEP